MKPWNKRKFLAEMRSKGWKCISYVPLVYQSKDDPTLEFRPNKYDTARHETLTTRRAR